MEFYYYSPSETFVVLTADQFVGLLEQQRQDSHVCRKTRTFPLILRKNKSLHYKGEESLYGGQITLSTQLIKPNYLVILPPTQHHSFFRNVPPKPPGYRDLVSSATQATMDQIIIFCCTKNVMTIHRSCS